MRIAVARETRQGETRVALVPELVGELIALGHEVYVEPGAGSAAGFADEEYAGATIDPDALAHADLVLAVRMPATEALRPGAALIVLSADGPVHADVTVFAMDRMPRVSRAQSMDALTSQSFVAGYRGAVVAAGLLRRFFPPSITAAGTIPPAEVLVLGAGVAGLEAIATARRLGAVVKAYDVRAASAEEIASVGGEPIDLGLEPLEGAAGYAREMTPERTARQRALLTPYVANADALITTAAVPGKVPPVLVTREMVERMRPGSVVVDLTADAGGNVEGVVPGEIVRIGHAQVWGGDNVPGQLPGPASQLYARNVLGLVALMTRAPDDEILASCRVAAEE